MCACFFELAGRKRRFTPPPGFTQCPKLRAKYEEYGVKLGQFYLWYPDRAIKAWSFLGGTLGPRWTLEVFRYHWIKDNPGGLPQVEEGKGSEGRKERRDA